MFLLNSCLGRFSAAALTALLLPKLRSHFAEFLNNTSPVGLRILSSSTCVGLRYGPRESHSGFSRRPGAGASLLSFAPRHAFALRRGDFPPLRLSRLHRDLHSRLPFPVRVPAVLSHGGAGIWTCCPSDTLLSLSLGPDLPRADQLYPGNLGYSAVRIPTLLSLLIPAFSLPACPHALPVMLRPCRNAPLPMHMHPAASVWCFSPGHFRRGTSRPVSCYALFQCMAASEPTSWLSSRSHFLSHLTPTLGP